MSNGYDPGEFEAILESFESDDEEDEEEAVRRRRFRRPSRAGTGLVPPRFTNAFVSESRLQTSFARVDSQFNKIFDATQALSVKVMRQNSAMKKEINGLRNASLASAVAGLVLHLTRPASETITLSGSNGTTATGKTGTTATPGKQVKVLVEDTRTVAQFLPYLPLVAALVLNPGLLSSQGGSTQGGSKSPNLLGTALIGAVGGVAGSKLLK